ncbi:MAG: ferritin-like domain-containing protein [Actinobacteria bacterium]|nr:ferritin-like domain-containing protein [Actinomycetota bacterium]
MTEIFVHKSIEVETEVPVGSLAEELGTTRDAFLKRAAIFGGSAVAAASVGMVLPQSAFATKKSDLAILNFALTLEYLESSFYAIAVGKGRFSPRVEQLAKVIRDHEIAHVKALVPTIKSLGGTPVKKPRFNFPPSIFADETTFLQTAMALEDTGVGAYNGAGPALTLRPVKEAAASIVAVEAMHASWVRGVAGTAPAPASFDELLTDDEVLAAAGPFFA